MCELWVCRGCGPCAPAAGAVPLYYVAHTVCMWCVECACAEHGVVPMMIDIHMERRVQITAVRLLRSL